VRSKTVIGFNVRDLPYEAVKDLFRRAGRPDLVTAGEDTEGFYMADFWDDPSELGTFRSELKGAGLSWFERIEHIYSDDELTGFPLLSVIVTTAERGDGGAAYGTEYDLSQACTACGAGAVQISPLRLAKSEAPRRGDIFQTHSYEVLVSQRLTDRLLAENVTGIEFRQAIAAVIDEPLPWFQLIPDRQLPPMHDSTKGIVRDAPCQVCGRGGYFYESYPTEIIYEWEKSYDPVPDFARTCELFGIGKLRQPLSETRFSHPRILVSPRVFKTLRSASTRGVLFDPVRFI